jgi:hypothetical protein
LQEKLSPSPEPVLHSLAVAAMLLANLGLALSIYRALSFSRTVKTNLALQTHFVDEGGTTQTLSLTPAELAPLIKVLSGILPYLAILFALAAWVMTSQLIYLIVALATALLAAGWDFYLTPSPPFDRSSNWRAAPLMGLLTGLFLLMQIIIVMQR